MPGGAGSSAEGLPGDRAVSAWLRHDPFLSASTPRNGQPSAMAADIVHLMDALNIRQADLAGFDWGARTADIVAALWPQRVKSPVSVSGYLISSQQIGENRAAAG